MKRRYKIAGGAVLALTVGVAALVIALAWDSDCPSAPAGAERGFTAITYGCYGPPDVLHLSTLDMPEPRSDELLVRVAAASVNPLDWHFMRGKPYALRLISGIGAPTAERLGTDFAGVVEAVGPRVGRFRVGDRVFGGARGSFAQYVVVSENGAVAALPNGVTFEQGASVGIAGITALQALRDHGELESGQRVLVNGASGGVGTFAVQIAKSLGAEVTGVCSTRNLELVRSIGADHVIDYTKHSYPDLGERYDVIIDNVGNFSPLENRRALVPGGILVMVGGPGGDWIGMAIGPMKALIASPFVDEQFRGILATMDGKDLARIAQLMSAGQVEPVIDRHYPLRDIRAAMAHSESGRARGKIIIDTQ